jgi:DNA-binding NarL/FixJ family response regulator
MPILVLVVDPRPLVREALTRLLEGEREFEVSQPVPTLQELFLGVPTGRQMVALVGAPALRQADEQALRESTGFGKPLRILVLADEHSDDAVCRLLMLGCSGYLSGDASGDTLRKAIKAVARGEIWAERQVVARTLQQALAAAGADDLLTSREREILGLLRGGHTNRQIAELLFISPDTVKWHIRKVFAKIGAKDRLEATLWARANNIFPKLEKAPVG